ncbi:MAG: hypothetical protein ACHRXM_13190 [Isosphaerales bacterium]
MPEEQQIPDQQYQFAVAMATGQRASVWAKKNGVCERTCYNWRKTKEYRLTVQEVRRRTLDRAVGHFARKLTKAADRIALLATEAQSESVQLQAARAMFKEFTAGREHVDLEEQMVDIERRLDERDAKVP